MSLIDLYDDVGFTPRSTLDSCGTDWRTYSTSSDPFFFHGVPLSKQSHPSSLCNVAHSMPSGQARLMHVTSREYSSDGKWNPRIREVPLKASSANAVSGGLKDTDESQIDIWMCVEWLLTYVCC
jgi:hypothetical protein